MKKKVLSLVLALALILALGVPTLAAEQTVIYVNTAAELREAIGSDRTIVLSEGVYDLRADYDERWNNYESYYLNIQNINNLTLTGNGEVELMNASYSEVVVSIEESTNVSLENLKIGHGDFSNGGCIAGVLQLYSSSVTVKDCDLYGCGMSGFHSEKSSIILENTVIRDCSESIMEMYNSTVICTDCTFRGNGYLTAGREYSEAIYARTSALIYENCVFSDNLNANLFSPRANPWGNDTSCTVNFINCVFSGNGWSEEQQTPEYPKDVAGFIDVPAGANYADAVIWAKETGVTYGKTDTLFGTMDSVTRAQAMTFLYRATGKPPVTTTENPFTDIDPAAFGYAEDAILWAVENGITVGRDDTHFDPGGSVTYIEMLTFMARTAGVEVSGDNWQEIAADWARENNIGIYPYMYEIPCPRSNVIYYLWKQLANA